MALPYPRTLARFLRQLERGLEEVHEQPHSRIEMGECGRCLQPFEPPIADHAAHNRAVLLLDPGLIILAIRAAARELDTGDPAILLHGLVHEHAVVVGVEHLNCKIILGP